MGNAMITVKNVSKTYRIGEKEYPVLQNINFEIKDQEIAAIIGPSGSGKSTMLNLLSGLDHDYSGEICYNDYKYSKLSEKEITKLRLEKFGYIFQSFHLIHALNVRDNILLPLKMKTSNQTEEQIQSICEKIGILDLLNKFPHQLSGGEQQRVAIARAVVGNPAVIFSDEATGNLDSKNTYQVMELLLQCCQDFKTSLIFVTHDESLLKYASKMLRIEELNQK